MTPSDKLREIAVKWSWRRNVSIVNNVVCENTTERHEEECLSDLTALISEGYVEKAKYDEAVRQRDELREALKQIKDMAIFVRRGSMDAYKMQHIAEAAIKNTEG